MARIVVIDDDDGYRDIIAAGLGAAGHRVSTAADGAEGIRMALETGVELVITEMLTPGRDGFEVLRTVRRERPGVLVIAISGDRQQGTRLGTEWLLSSAIMLGARTTLAKPFSHDELLGAIMEALR